MQYGLVLPNRLLLDSQKQPLLICSQLRIVYGELIDE